jgi:hypothetical protein
MYLLAVESTPHRVMFFGLKAPRPAIFETSPMRRAAE